MPVAVPGPGGSSQPFPLSLCAGARRCAPPAPPAVWLPGAVTRPMPSRSTYPAAAPAAPQPARAAPGKKVTVPFKGSFRRPWRLPPPRRALPTLQRGHGPREAQPHPARLIRQRLGDRGRVGRRQRSLGCGDALEPVKSPLRRAGRLSVHLSALGSGLGFAPSRAAMLMMPLGCFSSQRGLPT